MRAWLLILSLYSSAALAGPKCPDLDPEHLHLMMQTQQVKQLVFFATWCSSCVPHLREKHPEGTLLIASFSERDAAEAVMEALHPDAPCYLDRGLAKLYHVRALPAVLSLD